MKRKFKFITSVASLVASMALIIFGVYAVNDKTTQISGTLNFTATDVLATVQVYEYVGTTVPETFVKDDNNYVGEVIFDGESQLGGELSLGSSVNLGNRVDGNINMGTSNTYTFVLVVYNDYEDENSTIYMQADIEDIDVAYTGILSLSSPATYPNYSVVGGVSPSTFSFVYSINTANMTGSTITQAITASFELSNLAFS